MLNREAACESGSHMLTRCLLTGLGPIGFLFHGQFLCPVLAGLGISGCLALVPWGLCCLYLVWFSPPSGATHSVTGLVAK